MKASAPSGLLEVKDDLVTYTVQNDGAWRFTASELRVIGEYTTCDGPWGDDYFFVFLTNKHWFEASFDATGRDEALRFLEGKLGRELRPRLHFSTELASRVLWPPKMEDHALFDFLPQKPPSIFGRLKQCIFPRVDLHFTAEVTAELDQ